MITRIIIYAILFYALFLLLRFLMKIYISYTKRKQADINSEPRSRIDLNKIEDADFEEIKKQGDGEKN